MSNSEYTLHKPRLSPLSSGDLRRSLYTAALLALLLPPFIGGTLMTVVGFYPPTPAENIDAVLSALEEFQRYWWE